MIEKKMEKSTTLGQVFTPLWVVNKILDDIGYVPGNILNKTIMEPSFGEGIFLYEILNRLIKECKNNKLDKKTTIEQLERNIYGIELDPECVEKTESTLAVMLAENGLEDAKLNLYTMNSLDWNKMNYFYYVVGNPPYIRIHNLDSETREKIKHFSFSKGMTDLYVVFYELGLKMLKEDGKLSYISPNSFIKNTSQKSFRKYLIANRLIEKITDYQSKKVFENFDTYTCIMQLNKANQKEEFEYTSFNENEYTTVYGFDELDKTGKPWLLTSPENKELLRKIAKRKTKIGDIANVQYGFATNKDSVFIDSKAEEKEDCFIFNHHEIEKSLIRKVVKASKYHGKGNYWILFPYKKEDGKMVPYSEKEMMTLFPKGYEYLSEHKEELLERDLEKPDKEWFIFARSQGLTNTDKKKLVLNQIVENNKKRIEVYKLDEDTYVYSGLYITADKEDDLQLVEEKLSTKEFCQYILATGKDMSGGYKTYNSKLVEEYKINK